MLRREPHAACWKLTPALDARRRRRPLVPWHRGLCRSRGALRCLSKCCTVIYSLWLHRSGRTEPTQKTFIDDWCQLAGSLAPAARFCKLVCTFSPGRLIATLFTEHGCTRRTAVSATVCSGPLGSQPFRRKGTRKSVRD